METHEILDRALGHIEFRGWAQDAFARDERGESCSYHCDLARCFCSIGAVYRATPVLAERDAALKMLARCLPPGFEAIHQFNDHPDTTREMVIDLFRQAIQEARIQ